MCEFQRKAACKFLDLQAAFLRKLRADFADAEPLKTRFVCLFAAPSDNYDNQKFNFTDE